MYFIISFICHNTEYFCIWFSDEDDYILSKDSDLTYFQDKNELLKFACENSILLEVEETVQYDIDKILLWCETSSKVKIKCDEVLNFWNICSDAAKGMNVHFSGNEEKYDALYEKIFLGNNITNISSLKYTPTFSNTEIKTVKSILLDGINLIKDGLSKN